MRVHCSFAGMAPRSAQKSSKHLHDGAKSSAQMAAMILCQDFLSGAATFDREEFDGKTLAELKDLCHLAELEGQLDDKVKKDSGAGSSNASTAAGNSGGGSAGTAGKFSRTSSHMSLGVDASDERELATPPSTGKFKDKAREVLRARGRWNEQVSEWEALARASLQTAKKVKEEATKDADAELESFLKQYIDVLDFRVAKLEALLVSAAQPKKVDAPGGRQAGDLMPNCNALVTLGALHNLGADYESAASPEALRTKQQHAHQVLSMMGKAVKDVSLSGSDIKCARSARQERSRKKAEKDKKQAEREAAKTLKQKEKEEKKKKEAEDKAKKKKLIPGAGSVGAASIGSIFEASVDIAKLATVDLQEPAPPVRLEYNE